MIKQVTKYETSDGSLFDSVSEASDYEAFCVQKKCIVAHLKADIFGNVNPKMTLDVNALADWIASNYDAKPVFEHMEGNW